MATPGADNSIKAAARSMVEKELRYRKFAWDFDGDSKPLSKAWFEAEGEERVMAGIALARSMSLRERLMANDRAGRMLWRLERLRQRHLPPPLRY